MIMKSAFLSFLAFALTLAAPLPSNAQQPASPPAAPAPVGTPAAPPSAGPKAGASELEKLAMPIALYPDPLISIILPAAAYPVEIVQAARFVRDTNNLPKIDQQPWDENVKSVAKIPQVIALMDKDLDWTLQLGQAFVDQPKELMDAIQGLRLKADKAGTLRTTEQQIVVVTNEVVQTVVQQQTVVVTNTVVQIVPANPQVVYVPTYPYTVYYPPPAYVYNPVAPLVTFGVGVAVGAIIANNCDWHGGGIYVGGGGFVAWGGGGYHGDVNVDIDRNTTINRGARPTPYGGAGQKWQPDQNRLRTSGAGGATASSLEARGWGGGSGARPSTGTVGARPATQPSVGARPTTGNVGARPATTPSVSRPSTQPAARPSVQPAARPSPAPSVNRAPSGGSAFGGMNNGAAARSSSNRGAVSRGGGFGGGGRGGGGRR